MSHETPEEWLMSLREVYIELMEHDKQPWVAKLATRLRALVLSASPPAADTGILIEELTKAKDGAYRERDQLVAALSKLFPAHLCRHPEDDTMWENDWRWIVCIHLPTGQATWHIHDSEVEWFAHLDRMEAAHWDGHSTEEKYHRLAALARVSGQPVGEERK